jgi:hypothetical protein
MAGEPNTGSKPGSCAYFWLDVAPAPQKIAGRPAGPGSAKNKDKFNDISRNRR